MKETATQKKRRLEKAKSIYQLKRALETEKGKEERLKKRKEAVENESQEQRALRLLKDKDRKSLTRKNESLEKKKSRLAKQQERMSIIRVNESEEQRALRIQDSRDRMSNIRANESEQAHQERLQRLRETYAQRLAHSDEFYREINSFCNNNCDICLKMCYPNQIVKYHLVTEKLYLPQELLDKGVLDVCHICNNHLKNQRKIRAPAMAYWNNLNPGNITDEIKDLTQSEMRLLQRIIPFLKVIKFDGRFGQYGFKGLATLFALDIFQVTEKLPTMLPRSSDDANIVVVTETLENLNVSRDFAISRERVYRALNWLIANNPLYRDVTVDYSARLNTEDIIRVIPPSNNNQEPVNEQNNNQSSYITLDASKNISRIVRATWNQGNAEIFDLGYAGIQCFAMAVANIVRAKILPPSRWDTNTLNNNMIEGDGLYALIRNLTDMRNGRAFPIASNGYLTLENLDVIKNDFLMYNKAFSLDYDGNWICQGILRDDMNNGDFSRTLYDALIKLFEDHKAGILIGLSKTFAVMNYEEKYYFTDSHSCGPKGAPLKHDNGNGCIIECDNLQELHRIIRRVLNSCGEAFAIHYIDVNIKDNVMEMDEYLRQNMQHPQVRYEPDIQPQILTQHVHVQTSMMTSIDFDQHDFEDEFTEGEHINEILRKTKDNIVNINYEKKAEEFAWYFLFPYGKNGLNEQREVRITPLQYFKSRIQGTDARFQRNDYLFWALASTEFFRIQSSISACGKSIRGQDGMVDDLHMYMKNLRGSASYWRKVHSELVAQIRCLGPPTWFITLSCNDLNWNDMRKALLIADGRPNEDPNSISIDEAQKLIELYPVIVSRHFMKRLNAFMRYIQKNDNVLGGKLVDFWRRIEFQNRGSPHTHMVVWIENVPSFDTDAGVELIDKIISCYLPSESEDTQLHNLVKKNQLHRHTHTCHKNNSERCRFGFPRVPSEQTRIISQTSDEFIRNCGRICVLKRRSEDKYVNNYNPAILSLWQGNMDIQPCGTNEAIAQYISKYISKSEPTNVNESVAQAIREIRREETNISRKLFKSCMRILKERQLSACECAFRLCHLSLHESSRSCVFINTRKPEQRYYVIRFEGNQATGLCSNIIERYKKRPRDHPMYNFNEMCLLEFAMLFETDYNKSADDAEESIDAETNEINTRVQFIKLTDNTKMKIRNKRAVVRVPFFMMHTDPENYFYSLLMQYLPFYSEDELIDEYESARDAFLAREDELKRTSRYMETFRERDKQLENAFMQAHAFNILEHPEEYVEAELEEPIPDQGMNDEQFQSAYGAMNLKQRELFELITRSIRDQLNGNTRRLKLFVTGGAGVGKTFTFNICKNQVNRCFGKTAAKVAALTGVAARLVNGSTLHSLLKLPVQKDGFLTPNMPLLTGNVLKILRQQWKDIQFLFIDEISMVPYEMLCMIDARLRQLKNNDEPFGGINVILFGDLMQLPPVKGAQVFNQPARFLPAIHLWRLFGLVELTQNMRQQGDTSFADLLNALRIGELNAQHFNLLMSKSLTEETGEFALNKAIRIFPLREQVEKHNKAVIEYYRSQGERIYKIRAQDQIVDATRNVENIDMDKKRSKNNATF